VPDAPGSAVLYWHVDDLARAVWALLAAGAREHQPINERVPDKGRASRRFLMPDVGYFSNFFELSRPNEIGDDP
jgi:hypothetical protein